MEYLSTLDAGFLEAEDTDPHVSLAVGALAVLGGPMPEFATFVAGLGQRLVEIPRFKQVLRTHTLDLGAPAWVDDVAFDLSHHVRLAAVPQPGDDAALFRLAADLMERRLDRDHPLWECWMIEGLGDGQWAILMKIHHCIADGIATTQLLARLSDEGSLLPIVPIALRVRTGVAILSYADELVFGITADYDAASDVNELAEGITRAAARLASLCTRPRPSSARLALDG